MPSALIPSYSEETWECFKLLMKIGNLSLKRLWQTLNILGFGIAKDNASLSLAPAVDASHPFTHTIKLQFLIKSMQYEEANGKCIVYSSESC